MRRIFGILLAALTLVTVGPLPSAQAAAARTPVIFVHGFGGSASNWTTAKSVFRSAGYSDSELFTYDYNSSQSNETSAAGLAAFVNQVRSRTGAARVDLVNHSMGGLVTRWYVKQLGGQSVVGHWASLAGANHGTTSAGACILLPSCIEMYPGSVFLSRLNAGDETPGSTRYRTWYSPCDGVILPYTSTTVSGATNTYVACTGHLAFLTDTAILRQVSGFMAS
ncbi:alpha/beta fold hydrolase [Micromonospora sp. NPDC049679]|uniref:esterase/lipase family protein n=1 Tax=Micromonospora sp. NPDC049679 TaxID=3155920 RepID=UPI0033DCEBDF